MNLPIIGCSCSTALRFKIRQPNAMLEELRSKFTLAYEMSGIAARVIEREKGLKVTEDEGTSRLLVRRVSRGRQSWSAASPPYCHVGTGPS